MRIFTPNKPKPRRPANGFTLVELMVVVTVMALAAAVVVLTLPSRDDAGARAATRFAARVAAVRDQAILSGRPAGVWMSASGYGFEAARKGQWSPLTTRTLKEEDWGKDLQAQFSTGPAARVRFDSVGLASDEVLVSIAKPGAAPHKVQISMNGDVSLVR